MAKTFKINNMKIDFKVTLNKDEFLAILEQCTVSSNKIFCDEISIEGFEEFKFTTDTSFTVEYVNTEIDEECNYGTQDSVIYCENFILDAEIGGYEVDVEIDYINSEAAIDNEITENL